MLCAGVLCMCVYARVQLRQTCRGPKHSLVGDSAQLSRLRCAEKNSCSSVALSFRLLKHNSSNGAVINEFGNGSSLG